MNYHRDSWETSKDFYFARQDPWTGAEFAEEDEWDADHIRLYTGRWVMVCLIALGALWLWAM